MEICNNYHDEIVYDASIRCPLCNMTRMFEEEQKISEDLRDEVDELKEEIKELKANV